MTVFGDRDARVGLLYVGDELRESVPGVCKGQLFHSQKYRQLVPRFRLRRSWCGCWASSCGGPFASRRVSSKAQVPPPFHTPVFVLTHHERPSFTLSDTTFHFLDVTPVEALRRAMDAAKGNDVRLGGGV